MKRLEPRQDTDNTYLLVSRLDVAIPSKNSVHYPIQNMSRGGIRFCSQEHFDIDERVNLHVYIDEKLSHKAFGRICYHDESTDNDYYGVSFLDNYFHASTNN